MTTFTSPDKPNCRFTLSYEALRYLKFLFSLSMGFKNYAHIDTFYNKSKLFIPNSIDETTEETEKLLDIYTELYEELYDNIENKILSYKNKDTQSILYKIFFTFDKEKNRNDDIRVIYSSEIRCLITMYNMTLEKYYKHYSNYFNVIYPFIKYMEAYVNDVLYY